MRIKFISALRAFIASRGGPAPISAKVFLMQVVCGINKKVYWPVHWSSTVANPENITIGMGTQPGLSPGCYIQGHGKINFGQCVLVAPNAGIISSNHSINNTMQSIKSHVEIADYCWIGFGAVILPGVSLGVHTVVAANAVVTSGIYEPYTLLAGNPAKVIKKINESDCVKWEPPTKMYGYLTESDYLLLQKSRGGI